MAAEYPVAKITNEEGTKLLFIFRRFNGRFRFIEYSRLGSPGRWYWAPTHRSLTYPTAEAAERDARELLPWMRPQSPD